MSASQLFLWNVDDILEYFCNVISVWYTTTASHMPENCWSYLRTLKFKCKINSYKGITCRKPSSWVIRGKQLGLFVQELPGKDFMQVKSKKNMEHPGNNTISVTTNVDFFLWIMNAHARYQLSSNHCSKQWKALFCEDHSKPTMLKMVFLSPTPVCTRTPPHTPPNMSS